MATNDKAHKCVGVTEEDYSAATEDYTGWCPTCESFTRDQTEPDADGYDCPECDGNEVVGAENALIMGMIDITEGDESDE